MNTVLPSLLLPDQLGISEPILTNLKYEIDARFGAICNPVILTVEGRDLMTCAEAVHRFADIL